MSILILIIAIAIIFGNNASVRATQRSNIEIMQANGGFLPATPDNEYKEIHRMFWEDWWYGEAKYYQGEALNYLKAVDLGHHFNSRATIRYFRGLVYNEEVRRGYRPRMASSSLIENLREPTGLDGFWEKYGDYVKHYNKTGEVRY